jgi:eukaryotic-like serine/threonine-protein kinase
LTTLVKILRWTNGLGLLLLTLSVACYRGPVMDAPGKVPDSINCHSCGAILDLTSQAGFKHVECKHCGALSVVPLQFGDFLLLNVIGVGGMGAVYKAIDLPLNRYLALKILHKKLSSDTAFVASFSSEARAAASINHPNVAQAYSFGERDGQYYLAMELCDRGSLDDRITKLGKLPELEVLSIGQQIASALRTAWQRGLLHRDVKPGNILFNGDGIPKIVDFGLARARDNAAEGGPEWASEQIWGTPYYVAPEKLRGKPEGVRSDIYSLGATLFHALAGRPPFDAATAGGDVAGQGVTDPALTLKESVPTVHEHTVRLITRMLARDPAERYGSYDEIIQDLTEAQVVEITEPVVTSRRERFLRTVLLGAPLAILVCAGILWFGWKSHLIKRSSTPAGSPPADAMLAAAKVIEFKAGAPWVKPWDSAMLQLTQGRYADAVRGYESALQLAGPSHPWQSQWIEFFEGMTLLAANRPEEANRLLTRARRIPPKPGVPEVIATGNFANVLIETMLGLTPLAEVEATIPRMPPWAVALTRLTAGFKYLDLGEFEKAAASFREYRKPDRLAEEPWAFDLQPLTDTLARQSDQAAATMSGIDSLGKAGKYRDALAELNAASTNTDLAGLKQALLAKLPELERTAAQARGKK